MPNVLITHITLTITKSMRWRPWKGLFAGKVVFDAFAQLGIEPDFPFKVHPPEKLSSELKPGTDVEFSVTFWGTKVSEIPSLLLEGLMALDYVMPKMVNVEELEERFEPLEGSQEPIAVLFEVDHLPTYYRFHGAYVPFPSARRMVLSAFKKVSEAFNEELKELAEEIAPKLEVVGGNFSKRIYKISHGQEVPAFTGKVRYYGILSEKEALNLLKVLELSKHLGLGQGGTMGFGTVKSIKLLKPSWETPVKVLSP